MRGRGWHGPVVAGLLLAVTAALHLPTVAEPIGPDDHVAGFYTGTFVRNWHKHGFLFLAGVPRGPHVLESAASGFPYMHHPPAGIWWFAVFGGSEAGMRLAGLVILLGCAAAIFLLFRPLLGLWAATGAALALIATPVASGFALLSYEPLVMLCGLAALALAHNRWSTLGRARRGLLAGTMVLGAWSDWLFAFWCLGLAASAAHAKPSVWLRRLVLPAGGALAGLGLVLLWMQLVIGTPGMRGDLPGEGVVHLFGVLVDRPPFADWARGALRTSERSITWPLLVFGGLGCVLSFRRDRRLTLGLLAAGLPGPLLFARHSINHPTFYLFMLPALLLGLCCLLRAVADKSRGAAVVGAAGVLAFVLLQTSSDLEGLRGPQMSRLGQALSDATRPPEGRVFVAHNVVPFGCYIDSDYVIALPIVEPSRLAQPLPKGGLRLDYLWMRGAGGPPHLPVEPELRARLEAAPQRPLSGFDGVDVRLVTLTSTRAPDR